MDSPEENQDEPVFQEIGYYQPREAERLFTAFEKAGIDYRAAFNGEIRARIDSVLVSVAEGRVDEVQRLHAELFGDSGPNFDSSFFQGTYEPMLTGIFTKVFTRPTLPLVLDAVAATGLSRVQFNMESVGLPPMPDEIPDELARQIRDETSARGLSIASVQGTFNMSHPDPEHRRAGLKRLRVLAEACETLGASVIAICIGTRDPENMWRHHPDNRSAEAWRDMTGCVREAVRMAEETGVTLALEPEVTNIVDSASTARRLLDEIGSAHLKITMDAANLFHAGELPRMAEILEESFALLGPDIILAHAKDILHDGEAGQEPAGKGLLDYPRYLSLLKGCGFSGTLLLHGLPENEVAGCVSFLKQTLDGIGA